MELSKAQKQAVETTEGPVVIVAGPGSGKTFTMVERVAYLIEGKQVAPEKILAITFTNKAAQEMRSRVSKRLSLNPTPLTLTPSISTFHALALDLLNTHGEKIDLPQPIEIIAQKEQQEIVKVIAKDVGDTTARDLLLAISKAKLGEKTNLALSVIERYQNELLERAVLDFDDLLIQAVKLLEKYPETNPGFEYIMVDEYQDTNPIQAKLLKLLAHDHTNVCIVGDPNQAIYGFRGATLENFFVFQKEHPEAAQITLSTNYRSTQAIVDVANAVIRESSGEALRKEGKKVTLVEAPNAILEAKWIVEHIGKLIGGMDLTETDGTTYDGVTYNPNDIAVLVRTHSTAKFYEKFFAQSLLPFTRFGDVSFFEREEIQGVLEALGKLEVKDAVSEELSKLFPEEDKLDLLLEELITRASVYDHLEPEEGREALLHEASLEQPEDARSKHDAVTIMTAHAAKGLEFPVMFVAGVDDTSFPFDKDGVDIEEEKRLLYVAMTRAEDELYITYPKEHMQHGEVITTKQSRFLANVLEEKIERMVITPKLRKKDVQKKLF